MFVNERACEGKMVQLYLCKILPVLSSATWVHVVMCMCVTGMNVCSSPVECGVDMLAYT